MLYFPLVERPALPDGSFFMGIADRRPTPLMDGLSSAGALERIALLDESVGLCTVAVFGWQPKPEFANAPTSQPRISRKCERAAPFEAALPSYPTVLNRHFPLGVFAADDG
jgi:hypothetical protein